MAKKKKAEAEEGEEGAKKGGKKKLIGGVVLLVVGLYAGKTFFAPGPSPAAIAAAAVAKETALTELCARQNGVQVEVKPETTATTKPAVKAGTPTTVAVTPTTTKVIDPLTERGPVLSMDPITVNLADGHYLKIGLALQLKLGGDAVLAKTDGLGAKALDLAIAEISTKTMAELGKEPVRTAMKEKLGVETCHSYDGEVLTVFFTDFVMQ
jgi:flagellar basal body-associated protein FliL